MNHIIINRDECKACYLCVDHCPQKCIVRGTTLNTMGYLAAEFKSERCTACGICFFVCPEPGAITVIKED
ncbi:MAG: 4Fe-4S binding protein [Chitinispirillaceae bacterium]|nr:4Fe-4S binding protein [Chitinispirillaceae bacterium]